MHLEELMRHFEQETGLSICFYIHQPALENIPAFHINPDQYIHHDGPCLRHKLVPGDFIRCRLFKGETIADAQRIRKPFRRTCPFHVSQLCIPLFLNNELAGILYVSGKPLKFHPEFRFLAQFVELELKLHTSANEKHGHHDMTYYYLQTLDYIAKYYSRNIGLAEIAEKLQITSSHLGRIIRFITKKSFRELLTDRRMTEAEIYLKLHTMQSITQIARICGYEDSNYFSSVFSRRYGMSPRRYRQLNTGKQPAAAADKDNTEKEP